MRAETHVDVPVTCPSNLQRGEKLLPTQPNVKVHSKPRSAFPELLYEDRRTGKKVT